MKAFFTFLIASIKMLLRNRMFLIASLGISLLSVLAFGYLFSDNSNFKLRLNVVDQDHSSISTQLLAQLKQSSALDISTQDAAQAQTALRNGSLDAILVLDSNFGKALEQGHAQLKVFYNQSNPTTLAITRQAVQSIVVGINGSITGRPSPLTIQEEGVSTHTWHIIDFLLPGMLGLMLMWTNLNAGGTIIEWREQGILRRLAATPLRTHTLISAQMLARLLISLAQAAILLAVGILLLHVQMAGSWFLLALTIILGALTMLALGFGVSSVAKNPSTGQAITFFISFPMMFLGGSYFPVSSAPDFIKPLITILPMTYINDALRQIMNNGASLSTIQNDLLILIAWIIAGFLLAAYLFRWERA